MTDPLGPAAAAVLALSGDCLHAPVDEAVNLFYYFFSEKS
jgi:hypothetical protein